MSLLGRGRPLRVATCSVNAAGPSRQRWACPRALPSADSRDGPKPTGSQKGEPSRDPNLSVARLCSPIASPASRNRRSRLSWSRPRHLRSRTRTWPDRTGVNRLILRPYPPRHETPLRRKPNSPTPAIAETSWMPGPQFPISAPSLLFNPNERPMPRPEAQTILRAIATERFKP